MTTDAEIRSEPNNLAARDARFLLNQATDSTDYY